MFVCSQVFFWVRSINTMWLCCGSHTRAPQPNRSTKKEKNLILNKQFGIYQKKKCNLIFISETVTLNLFILSLRYCWLSDIYILQHDIGINSFFLLPFWPSLARPPPHSFLPRSDLSLLSSCSYEFTFLSHLGILRLSSVFNEMDIN